MYGNRRDFSLNMLLNSVWCAFSQCSTHVWAHKPILPPGMETALASRGAPGKAGIWGRERILHTYGAETNLGNRLSSNNQIIHVWESNTGGMWADWSRTFPSGTPPCVLGEPVDKTLLLSLPLFYSWSHQEAKLTRKWLHTSMDVEKQPIRPLMETY